MTLIEVGTASSGFLSGFLAKDYQLIAFHGFAGLSAKAGHLVRSPKFSCFGRQWSLTLYPGGFDENKGKIGMYLEHESTGGVSVRYEFAIKDAQGRDTIYSFQDPCITYTFKGSGGYGFPEFAKRSAVLKALVDGALVIDVRMKLLEQDSLPCIPKNPTPLNALDFFLDVPTDVVFEVGGNKKRRQTRSSLDPTIVEFRAHRSVVEKYAPDLMKAPIPGSAERFSIPIIKPEVFRHVLRYAYGGAVPEDALKKHSKELIEAADWYEMNSLKITAEPLYVQTAQINKDTLEEHLLFAGDCRLALLKEAAVDFIIESGFEIEELNQKAQKGLAGDIQRACNKNAGDNFGKMRVNELRQMLEEKGLDIGGSKKQMIDALREAAAKSDEAAECAANLGKMKV